MRPLRLSTWQRHASFTAAVLCGDLVSSLPVSRPFAQSVERFFSCFGRCVMINNGLRIAS